MKKLHFIVLMFGLNLTGCQTEIADVNQSGNANDLAKVHCSSCHLFPRPDELPKETWRQHVLPRMGYLLGIFPDDSITRNSFLESGPGKGLVLANGLFPERPALDSLSWTKIKEFYVSSAPVALKDSLKYKIHRNTIPFEVKIPKIKLRPPSATLLGFDASGPGFFLGDANSNAFYQLDKNGGIIKKAFVREGAVWMERDEQGQFILVMGSFSPTDNPAGFLMYLPDGSEPPQLLIDQLRRPVHFSRADLNADGRMDFVICEFGKWAGRLAWWEQTEKGEYQVHPLSSLTGATKAFVRDLNQDGRPDILALFGQGAESIRAFINQGDERFAEQTLLSFPATYGSSFMRLVDWDGDGLEDILYAAGDNADYPPILKPYHGLYLFRNQGKMAYEQLFHLPQNGAYAAVPADFDLDGDMDLASISFFPNFKDQPEEAFLFWENQGKNGFKAHALPPNTLGRWIVMAEGDADGDGDLDLALGSLTFEVIPKMGLIEKWVQQGIPFILLENQSR